MRRASYATVQETPTSAEAERMMGWLRNAGLHPVDLVVCTPLLLAGDYPKFPVQVPAEEAEAARQVLRTALDEAA